VIKKRPFVLARNRRAEIASRKIRQGEENEEKACLSIERSERGQGREVWRKDQGSLP